jgi:hypothetical protein
MHRGSRKHILDWIAQPRFLPELLAFAEPVACRVTASSQWLPLSAEQPGEARLETFGPRVMPDHPAWPALERWWLASPAGANTPNWDLALSCDIEGRAGLLLVEAKANVPELSSAGKSIAPNASADSRANHERIGAAIGEARGALGHVAPRIAIDRDRHYQLSNRIAFAWKLASFGIPTVLLYLGFMGDEGIRDAGEPFADDAHWQDVFSRHLGTVHAKELLGGPVDAGGAAFWLLSRTRPVMEASPPRA